MPQATISPIGFRTLPDQRLTFDLERELIPPIRSLFPSSEKSHEGQAFRSLVAFLANSWWRAGPTHRQSQRDNLATSRPVRWLAVIRTIAVTPCPAGSAPSSSTSHPYSWSRANRRRICLSFCRKSWSVFCHDPGIPVGSCSEKAWPCPDQQSRRILASHLDLLKTRVDVAE